MSFWIQGGPGPNEKAAEDVDGELQRPIVKHPEGELTVSDDQLLTEVRLLRRDIQRIVLFLENMTQ